MATAPPSFPAGVLPAGEDSAPPERSSLVQGYPPGGDGQGGQAQALRAANEYVARMGSEIQQLAASFPEAASAVRKVLEGLEEIRGAMASRLGGQSPNPPSTP